MCMYEYMYMYLYVHHNMYIVVFPLSCITPSIDARVRNILGVTYIAIKVGLILTVEAGVFPLMCGWWIDICAFVRAWSWSERERGGGVVEERGEGGRGGEGGLGRG